MRSPVKYLVMSQLTNFLIKQTQQPLKTTYQSVVKFYAGICMEVWADLFYLHQSTFLETKLKCNKSMS